MRRLLLPFFAVAILVTGITVVHLIYHLGVYLTANYGIMVGEAFGIGTLLLCIGLAPYLES